MDVVAALVADRKAAELVQPGECPLDHPPVPAQARAGVDALAGDADLDAAPGQRPAAARAVVGLVGVQLGRAPAALPGGASDRGDRVNQFFERDAVVAQANFEKAKGRLMEE